MSDSESTLSYNGTVVLQAVRGGHSYGFEIMRVTSLPSGTVYPLLRRLEAGGLVGSEWEEDVDPSEEGRPRRRHYRLTPEGERALAASLERIAEHQGLLWGSATDEG